MEEKFIVIDHVLDSSTMKKMPLRNPYVIKVRQEAVLQLYGLKFQSVSTMILHQAVAALYDRLLVGDSVGNLS